MAEITPASSIPPNAVPAPAQQVPPPGLDATIRHERAARKPKESDADRQDQQERDKVRSRRAEHDAAREHAQATTADRESHADRRRGNKLDIRA